MRKHCAGVVLAAFLVLTANPPNISASDREAEKLRDAVEVLHDINRIPEEGLPPVLLKNAYGIAVIPGLIKAAFIVGGRHGNGVLSVRNKVGDWSNPCFVSMTGGSVGWQIGAQSSDIILVFKSRKSVDAISRGKFTLGADAAVAAGPVGRQAEAATDITLDAEIYSYSRSRGLFAGISLEGAALQVSDKSNKAFYDKPYISPSRILYDPSLSSPQPAEAFKKTMNRYVRR